MLFRPLRIKSACHACNWYPKSHNRRFLSDLKDYTPKIGLELHVQLVDNIKLLSNSCAVYGSEPNSHVSAYDAALPGSLPILRSTVIDLGLKAAIALNMIINRQSTFDRKHYFYPDLPSGYQVTQKYSPLAKHGHLAVALGESEFNVRIHQIQLEQDTGKSTHDPFSDASLLDLNRAGAALIEIVTEPDIRNSEEAAAFVRQLQTLLRYTGVSNGNMERGEMRCDVNVSVAKSKDPSVSGARCEIKNVNGIRYIRDAIDFEISRQIGEIEAGRTIEQATRGFDVTTGATYHLRSKGDAPDYRYMPDPELRPIVISETRIENLRSTLPELPRDMRQRLSETYGLPPRDIGVLMTLGENLNTHYNFGVEYFEELAKGRSSKSAANWFIHELLGQLSKNEKTLVECYIEPRDLGLIIDNVVEKKFNNNVAKKILSTYIENPRKKTIQQMVETELENAVSFTDNELEVLCVKVIDNSPEEVAKVKRGENKVFKRLIGLVMKETKGKADGKRVDTIMKNLLSQIE